MIVEKKVSLKPILESSRGVHLTAYLTNRGDLADLKSQLRSVIHESSEWLSHAMTVEERRKFLEPLDSLLNDARIFKEMKGNIGIFRKNDYFRLLNIPVPVEASCQVATSFHVKPLLRWLQGDQEFLLLGIEREAIHLYFGNQSFFRRVDSIFFPAVTNSRGKQGTQAKPIKNLRNDLKSEETLSWVNDWIAELTKSSKPILFTAGDSALLQILQKNLKYKNLIRTPVSHAFDNQNASELCHSIRKLLAEESKRSLEKFLMEFRFAEEGGRLRKNIFQISKAAASGKVRKLLVTDELNIFGRIDPQTGGLAIHPFDLDHEDDCILDDLAQLVLKNGGEVVVAKKNEIPKGRPILALVDDENNEIEKNLSSCRGEKNDSHQI